MREDSGGLTEEDSDRGEQDEAPRGRKGWLSACGCLVISFVIR